MAIAWLLREDCSEGALEEILWLSDCRGFGCRVCGMDSSVEHGPAKQARVGGARKMYIRINTHA